MATTKKGRSQDRKLVAAGQDYEVRHAATKSGVSKDDVKAAVKSAGNSREKVEQQLSAKK